MRKARMLDEISTKEEPSENTDPTLPWEIAILIGLRSEGTCPSFFTRRDFMLAENTMIKGGIDPDLVRYRFVQRTDLSGLPYMLYAEADDTSEDKVDG